MSSFSNEISDELCRAIWEFCRQKIAFCHNLTIKGHLFITIDDNVDAVVTMNESRGRNESEGILRLGPIENPSCSCRSDFRQGWMLRRLLAGEEEDVSEPNDDDNTYTTCTRCSSASTNKSAGSSPAGRLTMVIEDEDLPSLNNTPPNSRSDRTSTSSSSSSNSSNCMIIADRKSNSEVLTISDMSDEEKAEGHKSSFDDTSVSRPVALASTLTVVRDDPHNLIKTSCRSQSEVTEEEREIAAHNIKLKLVNQLRKSGKPTWEILNPKEVQTSTASRPSRDDGTKNRTPCVSTSSLESESSGNTRRDQTKRSLSLVSDTRGGGGLLDPKEKESVEVEEGEVKLPTIKWSVEKETQSFPNPSEIQIFLQTNGQLGTCSLEECKKVIQTRSPPALQKKRPEHVDKGFLGLPPASADYENKDNVKTDGTHRGPSDVTNQINYTSAHNEGHCVFSQPSVTQPCGSAISHLADNGTLTSGISNLESHNDALRRDRLLRHFRYFGAPGHDSGHPGDMHSFLGTNTSTSTTSGNVSQSLRYGTTNNLIIERSERWEQSSPLEYMMVLPPTGTRLVLRPADVFRYTGSPHMEQSDYAMDYSYVCHMCGVSLDCMQRYVYHTVREHNAYSCHTCRATFNSKAKLLRHRTVHTGLRNYECALCGKAYRHKTGCEYHLMHCHSPQLAAYRRQPLSHPVQHQQHQQQEGRNVFEQK